MDEVVKGKKWYENTLLVLAIIVAGVLAVIGLVAFLSQYSAIDVSGTISLHDSGFGSKGDSCDGSGGYSDISSAAQVTVSDNTNKILTVSNLSEGVVDDTGDCVFSFTVKNLSYSDVYQFEVSHRGKLAYSHQQLMDQQLKVAMTLGN